MGQKCRIIRQNILLFESFDLKTPIAELAVGTVLKLGKVIERNGVKSLQATISDGRKGYVSPDIHVCMIKEAILLDAEADAYESPMASSSVVVRLKKGDRFTTEDLLETADGNWVKISLTGGRIAYIPGNIQVSYVRAKSGRHPHKDMVYGALLFIGGIVFTVYNYSSAASSPVGGRYYVAWGAILFGAIQFFIGLYRSKKL